MKMQQASDRARMGAATPGQWTTDRLKMVNDSLMGLASPAGIGKPEQWVPVQSTDKVSVQGKDAGRASGGDMFNVPTFSLSNLSQLGIPTGEGEVLSGANPLEWDDDKKFMDFAGKYRDGLYGTNYDVRRTGVGERFQSLNSDNPFTDFTNWSQQPVRLAAMGKGDLSQWSSGVTMEALKQLFPNATTEEMDRAAYSALKAQKTGYAWSHNPIDTIFSIGGNLGGIKPEAAAALNAKRGELQAYIDKASSQILKGMKDKEKAQSKGDIAGVLGVLGGAFMPGASSFFGGGVLGGAAAGGLIGGGTAALSGGDVGKGILGGAVSGGVGGYASGLEGGANFVGPTQGNFFTPSSLVSAGGNLAGNLIKGMPAESAIKGAAGGLLGSGVSTLAKSALSQAGAPVPLINAGGAFAGNATSGIVKGAPWQQALMGAGIGAGSNLLGGMIGGDLGKFAGNVGGSLMKNALMSNMQSQKRSKPNQPSPAQMKAAFQKMTPQQQAALRAKYAKG